jgi:hypothetical protein
MGVYTVLDCTTPCTTTNTSVTPVDVGVYASGIIIINVTAVSGTSPSLTVNFQVCDGNASAAPANTNCVNHTTGSAITATGLQIIKIDHFPRYITVTSTISGTTPSFTFTVKGYFKPQSKNVNSVRKGGRGESPEPLPMRSRRKANARTRLRLVVNTSL